MHPVPLTVLSIALLTMSAAAPAQIAPGRWEMVTTVKAMEMPGVPAGLLAAMKGRPITVSHCVTAAEAAKGPQEMMKGNRVCTFTRYTMAGGKLDSTMVCKDAGSTTTATSTGTYTPTSFTTTGRSVTTGARAATVTIAATGRRTGDCR